MRRCMCYMFTMPTSCVGKGGGRGAGAAASRELKAGVRGVDVDAKIAP